MEELLEKFKKISIEISNLFNGDLGENIESTSVNKSGDVQDSIDVLSNNIFKEYLELSSSVHSFASEEENNIVKVNEDGKYYVVFDPLDGSQNIKPNLILGSIFGVFETTPDKIVNGRQMVAAGYMLYGPALQLVFAYNKKVTLYRCNRRTGKFEIEQDNMKLPYEGKFYSINESNRNKWISDRIRRYFTILVNIGKSNRWDGCMVADVHRLILLGGTFSYPRDKKNTNGRLRLLYECYPMSFIVDTMNGCSITDSENKMIEILDLPYPKDNIHVKAPILMMGPSEFDYYISKIDL